MNKFGYDETVYGYDETVYGYEETVYGYDETVYCYDDASANQPKHGLRKTLKDFDTT